VGVLWPPGCYKCILIGAAHSSRLKLCSSALLAFHCLRPRHRMPSYPPAPQLPSHRVSSKMGKRENYIEDFCIGWWGWNYHLFTVCVILIKLLGGTVKRVKKRGGHRKNVGASTSIPFSNTARIRMKEWKWSHGGKYICKVVRPNWKVIHRVKFAFNVVQT